MPLTRLIWLATAYAMLAGVFLGVISSPAAAQTADSSLLDGISSKRYIVIDQETGEVYAEKDADIRAGMASVTKIFTAIVALERAPLDMEITIKDSDMFDWRSTKMPGLAPGVTFTVRDLLYGMILESGNDAAQALARGIGFQQGDTDDEAAARFIGWMNEKAVQLGLSDTHYANPHGLSAPGHYTTPRDLAAFMMYAVQNEEFMALISARQYTATTGDVSNSINRGWEFIPDLFGGKTGYDDDTGYCLVEVGRRGDVSLISVTIDGVAPDIWYMDHALLQDYGFAAREDRIASGAPVGDNRVAYAQLSGQDAALAQTGSAEEADAASDDSVAEVPEVALVPAENAPRPVLITGDAQRAQVAAASPERGSAFDNWEIGIVILAVIGGWLILNSGIVPQRPLLRRVSNAGIDTQA